MTRWMDQWADHLQHKSDERQARWESRRRKRTRSGRMTVMDRQAARLQRRSDQRQARWQELERFRQQVPTGPVTGPDGSTAVILVYQSGAGWLTGGGAAGGSGGGGGAIVLAAILITEAIWWLVFRRSSTVYVRTNGRPPPRIAFIRVDDRPPVKVTVRLPTQVAAYRAAAELVRRFQADGPGALQGWRADAESSSTPRGGVGGVAE
jgi:hypothetical protein